MTLDPSSQPSSAARGGGVFFGVAVCFLLSGFAALLYQTAWLRQFSTVFGTSELAVATVLGGYMAGLATGAAVAARYVDSVRRPVLVYGLLELGIALGALFVPFGMRAARALSAALIGGQPELADAGGTGQTLFYLVAAFAVIVVPTALMGATLPLLTRYAVRRPEEIGPRVGLLYALNTVGAVGGTIVAAFVLLPRVGLGTTVWVGVGINAVVFAIAVALAAAAREGGAGSGAAAPRGSTAGADPFDARARWILPLILVAGITSFVYEILWTRLLAHLLGGSVYAFATMLASFLTGIALGSAIAAPLARKRRQAAVGFVVAELGLAFTSMWVFGSLDGLTERFLAAGAADLGARVMAAALVLLPSATCIGALFPFALRVLSRGEQDAGPAAARVYAWNTVGAILGAILAGFWLVPAAGFAGSLHVMVATNLALAVLAALAFSAAKAVLAATALIAVAALVLFRPALPETLLRYSVLTGQVEEAALMRYLGVGRAATVTTLESGEGFEIRSNGMGESLIERRGVVPFGRRTQRFLTLLPALARPSARTMLVIGFGGGGALERVPPAIEEVDVIELEPKILEANAAVASERRFDPLEDERIRVVLNDARGALALTDERWDLIVSQPSHPWTAGASHLYTSEFLAEAREHLNAGGVFLQWMSSAFIDESLLRSLTATMLVNFEHVRLYRPIPAMLVFLGSDAELDVERDVVRTGEPMRSHVDWWANEGFWDVHDVAALLALEQDGLQRLAADAPICTDNKNLLAMHASPGIAEPIDAEAIIRLFLEDDPLLRPSSSLWKSLAPHLDRGHLANRMVHQQLRNRAIQSSNVLEGAEKKLAQGRMKATWMFGLADAARADFEAVLASDPQSDRARFLSIRDELADAAAANSGVVFEEAQRLQGSAARVWAGWRRVAADDWMALRDLEPDLATVRPVDPWFAHATQLRVLWRLRAGAPSPGGPGDPDRSGAPDTAALASEALILIDRSLVLQPDPELTLLRLEAAELAGRADAVLETLTALGEFSAMFGSMLAQPRRDRIRAALRARIPKLEQLLVAAGTTALHADSIRSTLARGPD